MTSTMACALVVAKAGPLVAHVEAGLRSRDWSMPEEVNRVVTDRVSDVLFAPSPDAVDNLAAEGYQPRQVHLVGNVMVDSLLANLARAEQGDVLARLSLDAAGTAWSLCTGPPTSTTAPHWQLSSTSSVRWPGNARWFSRSTPARPRCWRSSRFPPVSRRPPHWVPRLHSPRELRRPGPDRLGRGAGRDDGPGCPRLTLRDNTERPITVSEGTNVVVGRDRDRILAGARQALDGQLTPWRPALWDGHAGERIADILLATPALS